MHTPVCEHCEYGLTGVPRQGLMAKCPECGGWSDTSKVPVQPVGRTFIQGPLVGIVILVVVVAVMVILLEAVALLLSL